VIGNAVVTLVLALVLAFFFLKDGPKFLPWLRKWTGESTGRHVSEVSDRVWTALGQYVWSQAAVALVDAVFIGLGVWILGVPFALPIAVLTFFGGFVPIIGAFVAGAIATLVALVSGGIWTAVGVLAIVLVVQQLEGNVLQPILVGRTMKIHAAVVIAAVALGGTLFGIIGAFLADLETKRGAGVTTRNLRLNAVRSFFRFVSFEEPAHSALIQRVLAIPSKRHDKREVSFLTRLEIEAILGAPDRTTWLGRRDYTLLLLAVQTGLRLSELIGLNRDAIHLGAGAHVRCVGKGRKERCTPLSTHVRSALQVWLREPARKGATALIPNVHGGRLSADSIQSLLAKHVRAAAEICPSLKTKRVSPHVLRHSAAMELLQAGVDSAVIALWLGHESVETTQTYLHAHIALKEAALAKLKPYEGAKRTRFRPDDRLLAFLESL